MLLNAVVKAHVILNIYFCKSWTTSTFEIETLFFLTILAQFPFYISVSVSFSLLFAFSLRTTKFLRILLFLSLLLFHSTIEYEIICDDFLSLHRFIYLISCSSYYYAYYYDFDCDYYCVIYFFSYKYILKCVYYLLVRRTTTESSEHTQKLCYSNWLTID